MTDDLQEQIVENPNMDDEIPDDFVAQVLRNAVQMLGMVPLERLRGYVAKMRGEISRADALGPIMDPSGYRAAISSGAYEDARFQLAVVEHMVSAVEVGAKRDEFVRGIQEAQELARQRKAAQDS